MLALRSHPRAVLSLRKGCAFLARRGAKTATKAKSSEHLTPNDDVAKALADTKIWERKRGQRGAGDHRRINVTNEEFVNQLIDYIKPSLMRHEGCDLIDINPGAGVWSKALHNLLRPRSHILLEPDADVYKPFLGGLLERPGVRLEPRVGYDWSELNKILKLLPHQVEQLRTFGPDGEPPKRNDTLLVTVNMSMHPKKKLLGFDSLGLMVTHQLISSIRNGGLFQKYGLVRMLIWMRPDDMRTIFPRTVQGRRAGPINIEFNTEWIREVAGPDYPDGEAALGQKKTYFRRDANLDFASAFNTLLRMREQGIVVPPGRSSTLLREAQEMMALGMTEAPMGQTPILGTHIAEQQMKLEEKYKKGKIDKYSPEYQLWQRKKTYHLWITTRTAKKAALINELDAVKALYAAGDREEAVFQDREWNKKFSALNQYLQADMCMQRDQQHIFCQDPPLLHWDRRPYEPLVSRAADFFPNYQCSLLDVQPKAPHWLFRDIGPNSLYRAGECFDLILRHMCMYCSSHLSKAMAGIWPGVLDGVLAQCPSIYDPTQHGSPVSGGGELSPRDLNEAQWVALMEAWVNWPFKPAFSELVAHLMDEVDTSQIAADSEGLPKSMGAAATQWL